MITTVISLEITKGTGSTGNISLLLVESIRLANPLDRSWRLNTSCRSLGAQGLMPEGDHLFQVGVSNSEVPIDKDNLDRSISSYTINIFLRSFLGQMIFVHPE